MEHCQAWSANSICYSQSSPSAQWHRTKNLATLSKLLPKSTSSPSSQTSIPVNTGPHIHKLLFTGDLQPWPNFPGDVRATHQTHTWRKKILAYRLKVRDPYTYGNSEVGDEHGVQGRFQKCFGDVLNAIFKSQSINLGFADFKCIPSIYPGTPDVVMKSVTGPTCDLKMVGEIKVRWVDDHCIEAAVDEEDDLKRLLAQPTMYMQDLGCAYGFLSNYEETIFLRQVVDNNGVWRIEYSPVIMSTNTYAPSMSPPVVSVKQCFFHVGCEVLNNIPVNNTTPNWVVKT